MERFVEKSEGHGSLEIDYSAGQARLHILEGERLFEGMLLGRPYNDAYWITPRICGVCPIAHTLASLGAVEDAFAIKLDPAVIKLRKILLCAQIIQSHILHLYFLSLPDYLGIDRGTELYRRHPRLFKFALTLKKLADETAEIIAGRAIHPTTLTAGGFFRLPDKKKLASLQKKYQSALFEAQATARLVGKINWPDLDKPTEYLAGQPEKSEDYPLFNYDKILSSRGNSFTKNEYQAHIAEVIKDYSTAKFGARMTRLDNGKTHYQGIMVGAIARITLFSERLMPLAMNHFNSLRDKWQRFNTFQNNLAQGLEVLHFTEMANQLLKEIIDGKMPDEPAVAFKPAAKKGIGVVEAPRGILIHDYTFDQAGIITGCNIITPTVFNLTNLEEDANFILAKLKIKDSSADLARSAIEKLIRAYDPCITCSVH